MQPDQMSQTSTTSAVKSRRALELLDAVRTMTPQNIHVAFLSILSSFRKKEISTKQVHSQVNDLLRDYPVLLEKFASFLPPPSTATSVIQNEPTAAPIDTTETNQMKISDAVNFIEAVQKAYATRPHVYNMFLQLMQEYKRDTSRMQVFIYLPSQLRW